MKSQQEIICQQFQVLLEKPMFEELDRIDKSFISNN